MRTLPGNTQNVYATLDKGPPDPEKAGITVGQQLLVSLAGFMMSLNRISTASEQYIDPLELGNGSEGEQLLAVLTKFVRENDGSENTRADISSDNNEEVTAEVFVPEIHLSVIPTPPPLDPYGRLIHEQGQNLLRAHVFNKMPIRLLTFDSNGSGLELIERNELLRRLQDKFQKMSNHARLEKNQTLPLAMGPFLKNYAGYAILSHTWIRDRPGDVVYSEWKERESNQRGFRKIAKFCEVAAKEHGLSFGWMDTVCIDKNSSSELDESIRSMYKWYREAHVCLAYLSETQTLDTIPKDSWFTRGWTLQELLSPKKILFYNGDWQRFAHNEDGLELTSTVDEEIQKHVEQAARITGEELVLCQHGQMDRIPISRRIQLAAERRVTREEDEAYSLMGILGVDISVAYGEGAPRAFSRLMRELIMSQKDIMDIFNYTAINPSKTQLMPIKVTEFKVRATVFDNIGSEKPSLLDYWRPLEPIILTHIGVRILFLLVPALMEDRDRLRTSSPYGDFFGVVTMGFMDYFLLHSAIYANDLFTTPTGRDNQTYDQYYPLVATFGVFNFGLDANMVLLPEHCMAVSLNSGTADVGSAGPNSIKIIPGQASPIVLTIESKEGQNTIPKDELVKHGMKLMTLYL